MGKIHITLTPSSPSRSIKKFAIRRIYPLLIIITIIISIIGFASLYKYYETNYQTVNTKLEKLKNVQEENKYLKNELVTLTKDTEELRQALVNLEEYNEDIKKMVYKNTDNEKTAKEKTKSEDENIDFQLRTIVSYNNNLFQQGIPMGGGDFRLVYQEPQDLIKSMQHNINVVNEELPKKREQLHELENTVKQHNARQEAIPSIWPVADKGKGYISSDFGWRNDPTTSEREFHEGLDIAVWYNTPVLATAPGKISFVGWLTGYGWAIKINHGFGYKTIYGHLNRIKVKKGEEVKRGQIIGLSGNSGRSTGPHLHYEVKVNKVPKNPRKFIGR